MSNKCIQLLNIEHTIFKRRNCSVEEGNKEIVYRKTVYRCTVIKFSSGKSFQFWFEYFTSSGWQTIQFQALDNNYYGFRSSFQRKRSEKIKSICVSFFITFVWNMTLTKTVVFKSFR